MKYPCGVIKDVLPLYYDDACSDQTKNVVEEHLEECASCKSLLQKLGDNTYNNCLQKEKENVISHYKRDVRKKAVWAGLCVMAVILLVCFIVNIAAGRTLDWFFIVLTSLLVFASLTAPPLLAAERKRLWTLGSFAISLLLLLFVCCIYSRGDWLGVASAAVLFGLWVVFGPCVIGQFPLKGTAARNKGLLVMAGDTVLLYVLILACGLYGGSAGYWKDAFAITTVSVLFAWVVFAVIRYLKVNKRMKCGICLFLTGIFGALIGDIIKWILEGNWHTTLSDANLSSWNSDALINANCYLLVLLTGCGIGLILLVLGLFHKKKAE